LIHLKSTQSDDFAPAGIKVAIQIRVSYDAPGRLESEMKKVVAERLGEMVEELGSWVEYYRVQLDEEVLVVAFDLCSSSMIMEQLLLGGDVSCLTDLLTAIKRHLAAEQEHLLFDPYKFTGDGWILLFPANTDGSALMAFLERLCRFYSDEYRRLIKPNLENVLKIVGLSFGIDRGWISRIKMYGQTEYIGRPIIVACRLQGAVKDKRGSPAYKALVTYHAYRKHFTHLPASRVVRVKRILRNINAETPFGCKKIALLSRYEPRR